MSKFKEFKGKWDLPIKVKKNVMIADVRGGDTLKIVKMQDSEIGEYRVYMKYKGCKSFSLKFKIELNGAFSSEYDYEKNDNIFEDYFEEQSFYLGSYRGHLFTNKSIKKLINEYFPERYDKFEIHSHVFDDEEYAPSLNPDACIMLYNLFLNDSGVRPPTIDIQDTEAFWVIHDIFHGAFDVVGSELYVSDQDELELLKGLVSATCVFLDFPRKEATEYFAFLPNLYLRLKYKRNNDNDLSNDNIDCFKLFADVLMDAYVS